MELAKELGLSEEETEALRAAAVLHDIGKLAVPEHIISKPSKLTPDEFEKMKIHPIVGAEILEQVDFPYPVVPIVRAHHEKWNGQGYPDGLVGEAIPIGARILAAVDCLDALASDRQYRKALPLGEAMAMVASEAGEAFDPRVVEILQRRYVEWEKLARQQPVKRPPKLSTDIQVKRGLAPAAGFAQWEEVGDVTVGSGSRMAEARRQAQNLRDLARELRGTLSLEDLLALLAGRLQQLTPHDAIAFFLCGGNMLRPVLVNGENARVLAALQIPLGEGLAGWVAQNHKPILNGNPSVEPGYLNAPAHSSMLRSALAVPLDGGSDVLAVLALYRAGECAFNPEDLQVVEAMAASVGAAIELAARPRATGTAAGAD
jgi:putative nucleotidyltransferase with HDIG domain